MGDNTAGSGYGLAPYACHDHGSRGRALEEAGPGLRGEFQRDRDRVVHSAAFRRLEYKTQVFVNHEGDMFRTRLTHSIEVAQIARTVARVLELNEDLTEAIALAHDLGHTPFGHAGQDALNACMRDHGGFEHNLQSLRVVTVVERVYPAFDGLNLSYEVLEGLRKHDDGYWRPDRSNPRAERFPNPSLEAQIADIADEITYYSHDVDDGLSHLLISEGQLAELEIWRKCAEFVDSHYPGLEPKRRLSYLVRMLLDQMVADVVAATAAKLQNTAFACADAIRHHPSRLVSFSDAQRPLVQQLRAFLYAKLYHHQEVARPNARGGQIISDVFAQYERKPELIGDGAASRIGELGLQRTICDYISGMTDRYIQEEHRRVIPG